MTDTDRASSGRFYGLFVGVDRYQSPDIRTLSSAVRDARALHALFQDNLGGECTLLTDADATAERLRQELSELQHGSTENDVVVITFSGHGSETHELATYDADLDDLPGTCVPLAELTDLISGIAAKHLLIVLDCCFSGGAGAKVLHAPQLPRGGPSGIPLSTEALLNRIAGTGRLILTASTAAQEAWEDPRLGHGYLTYYLLQAFLGPGDLAQHGMINLYDLLKFVTESVRGSASGVYAARQDPTLRGQWDGAVLWPVFAAGPRYSALFPSATAAPVTDDLHSLIPHGLPESVVATWGQHLPGLNQLQQDAINDGGLLQQRNVVVMAPTSSGKTMIGELAALRATQTGGRSVFLLPTKALVNEQYDRFTDVYSEAGVRVIRATGDHNDDVPALLRGQFDLAIFTYEKFSGLVLAHPFLLRLISVVVVDEVQNIVDPSRGRELELLLTLIKTRADEGVQPQLIALSAVLGNNNGLESWLDAYLLSSTSRPVPLDEGVLGTNGAYRYIDDKSDETIEQLVPPTWGPARAQTLLIPLVSKLVADGQQVIVVRGERGTARGAALYLSQALGLPAANSAINELTAGDPTASSGELRRCLAGGVAFHTSDLGREDRRVVEQHFRRPNSEIRVVVATTTLAQGVNMPAETVVMPELSRRVGGGGVQWYTNADYKNIAGRAGRLGLASKGRSVVLAFDLATANKVWNEYVTGTPEDVHSTLLGSSVDVYTVVLRVAAIAAERSADGLAAIDDLVAILSSSFAAHQSRLRGGGDAFAPGRITQAVSELQQVGFLDTVDDRTRPSELGALVAISPLSVESGIRITQALRQMRPEDLDSDAILTVAQITTEMDGQRLTVNKKGIGKETATFVGGLQNRVARGAVEALRIGADTQLTIAARAKKATACLLWTGGVPLGNIERFVMQHYMDRNASGPISSVVARTRDVVDTVLALASQMHSTANLNDAVDLLPTQLEFGVPADSAALANAGANLRREDYLRLIDAGLRSPIDIDSTEDTTLLPLLRADQAALQSLRNAVGALKTPRITPSLDELLGPKQQHGNSEHGYPPAEAE